MTLCNLFADGDFCGCAGREKNLLVAVYRDKVNALYVCFNHTVYGVTAATADADDFNLYATVIIVVKFKTHDIKPPKILLQK